MPQLPESNDYSKPSGKYIHLGVVVGPSAAAHGLVRPLVELPRRSGEADVYGLWVTLEHFGPLAPSGTVALVDDDDAERIRRP